MKFAILGTGAVGQAVGRKLVFLGHQVMMGAREAGNEKAQGFAEDTGGSAGTFADAARFGDIVFNATSGAHSLDALNAAGAENLSGKILVDVANALDFSTQPPRLSIVNDDSLGETIQRGFPNARVVKTLCTVNSSVMVDPAKVPGAHVIFVSGNDAQAKAEVTALLRDFGWQTILDTGDITGARGQEMMILQWIRVAKAVGSWEFNYVIAKA